MIVPSSTTGEVATLKELRYWNIDHVEQTEDRVDIDLSDFMWNFQTVWKVTDKNE